MAYGTVSADIIQSSVPGVSLGAGNASIMKNRIINGAMVINQRAFSGNPVNAYTVDRWQVSVSQTGKISAAQSTTAPTGFVNSLLLTSLSAYTVGSGEQFILDQPIEGFNCSDLGWGTANAKTVTLSFQVYSSLTGTFGGSLQNNAYNRSYPFTYSIPVANTWTTISVTIAGDTSGTWTTDNSAGIRVNFGLGVGSTLSNTAGSWSSGNYSSATGATSVVGTNGATFYITGVQLEVGSSATGFEYRQYQQELALCQRYYYRMYANQGSSAYTKYGQGYATSTTNFVAQINAPTTMRTYPTTLDYSTTYSYYCVYDGVSNIQATAFSIDQSAPNVTSINMSGTGFTVTRPGALQAQATTNGYIGLGAEL